MGQVTDDQILDAYYKGWEGISAEYDVSILNVAHNVGKNTSEEELEWIDRLRENVDDELDYTIIAYRENPGNVDYEYIPFGKKRDKWLDIVYDAFDEICKRMKDERK